VLFVLMSTSFELRNREPVECIESGRGEEGDGLTSITREAAEEWEKDGMNSFALRHCLLLLLICLLHQRSRKGSAVL
jgi:hypothetical protein